MTVRVGVDGFGRIGRLAVRALLERDESVDLVAVNDRTDARTLAHLFRFDSVHGRFAGVVDADGDDLVIDGDLLKVLRHDHPSKIPWAELGVDVVVESTGRFTKRAGLEAHLEAGAPRVLLSAPGDADVTIVRGVNDDAYDPPRHRIVSAASCTTNCLAPILKVLHTDFGVRHALVTTVHAITGDQSITDQPHDDLRRARASWLNMIPTATGAARAIGLVLPELDGRVDGLAVRVPTANVSLLDITAHVRRRPGSTADVADALCGAADGDLSGILGCEDEPLVSVDYTHDARSAIVDLPSLQVKGDLVKVLAWYDNEWGYASRLADLVHQLAG